MTTYAPAHLTSIPGAVNDLYAKFTTAYPYDQNNQPVYVWFGQQLPSTYSAPVTIEINGIEPVVRDWATLGPDYRIEEDYSIRCKLTVFTGQGATATDYLNSMSSVFAVWTALETVVANDPTLSGNVRVSWFDEVNYEPTTDGSGRACGTITWVVRCQARVTTLS